MPGRRKIRVGCTPVRLALAGLAWWLVPVGLDQVLQLTGFLYSLAAVVAGVAAYLTPHVAAYLESRVLPTRPPKTGRGKPQPTIASPDVGQAFEEAEDIIPRRTLLVTVTVTISAAIIGMVAKDFASQQEGLPKIIYVPPPFASPPEPPPATAMPTAWPPQD